MTTLLPKLVTDIIDWYQWKAKIRQVNNEYHSSYFYNDHGGHLVHVYRSREYVRKHYNRLVNWRKIGNHHAISTEFYYVYPINMSRKQSHHKYIVRLPPTYCHCKVCEDVNKIWKKR